MAAAHQCTVAALLAKGVRGGAVVLRGLNVISKTMCNFSSYFLRSQVKGEEGHTAPKGHWLGVNFSILLKPPVLRLLELRGRKQPRHLLTQLNNRQTTLNWVLTLYNTFFFKPAFLPADKMNSLTYPLTCNTQYD